MAGSESSDLEVLPERSLPKTSLRFMLLLIAVSAIMMVIFRAAVMQQLMWAKVIALMITTLAACFLAYALLFLLVSLFAATTRPWRSRREKKSSVPELRS